MKRPMSQEARLAGDVAIQVRALAAGRLHTILTEHYTKARCVFLSLSEGERHRLANAFATKLEHIEPGPSRLRLMVHLGQIHGDLASGVARSFAALAGAKAHA
ncbi:catalase [Porphyrobacter sp. MBR-155]|uniref:catalase-related domain-containing protein n=1 Tax=Porphyrobacter sp. MBR-155 TaxID=3156464 RepID=UPI002ABCAE96|nr:catalase-related domain-containing protein [Erythrobacter sp.]